MRPEPAPDWAELYSYARAALRAIADGSWADSHLSPGQMARDALDWLERIDRGF